VTDSSRSSRSQVMFAIDGMAWAISAKMSRGQGFRSVFDA
jgi:hypothetical protein